MIVVRGAALLALQVLDTPVYAVNAGTAQFVGGVDYADDSSSDALPVAALMRSEQSRHNGNTRRTNKIDASPRLNPAGPPTGPLQAQSAEAQIRNLVEEQRRSEDRSGMEGDSMNICTLVVCSLQHRSTPRLFVDEHFDGYGHRMQNILDGIAVAMKNGMNFGGVVPLKKGPKTQFRNIINLFFGNKSSSRLFFKPRFDMTFSSTKDLETHRPTIANFTNIHLPSTDNWQRASGATTEYYTHAVRKKLRQQLDDWPLVFVPGKPRVALHVRRGDLGKSDDRLLNDEYFYLLVQRVRKLLPTADVHMWSSVTSGHWKSADFDGYRQKAMTVHLDSHSHDTMSTDIVSAWAHLARANVLILSRSSFSYVPAVLSQGCVIHPGMYPALDGWVDGLTASDEQLQNCVARGMQLDAS